MGSYISSSSPPIQPPPPQDINAHSSNADEEAIGSGPGSGNGAMSNRSPRSTCQNDRDDTPTRLGTNELLNGALSRNSSSQSLEGVDPESLLNTRLGERTKCRNPDDRDRELNEAAKPLEKKLLEKEDYVDSKKINTLTMLLVAVSIFTGYYSTLFLSTYTLPENKNTTIMVLSVIGAICFGIIALLTLCRTSGDNEEGHAGVGCTQRCCWYCWYWCRHITFTISVIVTVVSAVLFVIFLYQAYDKHHQK